VTVYVATKNAGKLRELRSIFAGSEWELATFPAYRDVDEGDDSYAGNAALKARALRMQLLEAGIMASVLGDDSGLEIASLGGRPGVRSARYGGETATWPQRRAALLAEAAASGSHDRRARFICALHYIDAGGAETSVRAVYDGMLADRERGAGGFSYDPIFLSPSHARTFAEIGDAEKNSISHRARAAGMLLESLSNAAGNRVR
jgi:XTP/dITP diphosphohydrolase